MIYVLFSGGMDSWACLNWAWRKWGRENVQSIYFKIEHRAAANEVDAVLDLDPSVWIKHTFEYDWLREQPGGYVEMRNMAFILKLAAYPDCKGVVFGMLKGETPADKTLAFTRRIQDLIRSQLQPSVYGPGREFRIYTPFARKTKTGVLRWLLHNTIATQLWSTVACLNGHNVQGQPCGECISCFSRWVAFFCVGISGQECQRHPAEWAMDQAGGWWNGTKRIPKGAWRMPHLSRLSWYWDILLALQAYCRLQGKSLYREILSRGRM